jgi:hypothetical protein
MEGKLVKAIKDFVENNEKVQLKDYDWAKVREIERDFRDERLETIEEIMERLKKIEHLWVGLNRDFRGLEKEIEKVL